MDQQQQRKRKTRSDNRGEIYIATKHNVDLERFCSLAEEHKAKTKESLKFITQTIRVLEEHEKIDKEMKQIIKSLKAPKGLTFLEKVVYFYNRKQGLTLLEIAETAGYDYEYIKNISARLGKKLNNNG